MFPATPVFDTFTRTENPLASGWTGPAFTSDAQMKANGSAILGAAAVASSVFNTNVGPDCEAYCDVVTTGGTVEADLYARVTATGSFTGYALTVISNVWTMQRVIAGAFTALANTATQAIASGSRWGIEVFGTGGTVWLNAYYQPSGGAWTRLIKTVDTNAARIVAAGKIGIGVDSATWVFDNFGGGTLPKGKPGMLAQAVNRASVF